MFLRALMKGLFGGYVALSLGVSLFVISSMDDPDGVAETLVPVIEKLNQMPGMVRLQEALARQVRGEAMAGLSGEDGNQSDLQKLRQRTLRDQAATE